MFSTRTILQFILPCLIAVPAMANTINVNPGQDLAGAIGSAQAGDTVVLGAGTFNVSAPINIPGGTTITGLSPAQTHVVFNLAGGTDSSYGFSIERNANNTTIQQIDFYSNHGIIQMSQGNAATDGFNNTVISHNNFQYGGGVLADGTLVFGLYGSMPNNQLQIVYNYFHDSTEQDSRNWCIWGATNSNLDHNVFYNLEDGGQISQAGPNVSFSYNYCTLVHRMCQEAGLNQQSTLTINGNVFYDWVNPYPDSDAL